MSMAGPLTFALFLLTVISLMAGFSVAFTLAGVGFFMAGMGWYVGAFDLSLLGAIPSRIFGTAMWSETMVAVPLFVFMGLMLEKSRVAEELLNSMGRLFGGLRGGLGISVFVVGALLAASTGVVGASVVTMGLMALPVMLKTGYDARFATGAICASGTLGQIIPPSIALIILAEQISNAHVSAQSQLGNWSPTPISVGDFFAGALLPGMVLVALYVLYQIIIAWRRPESAPPVRGIDGEVGTGIAPAALLRALLPPVGLIVAVLGSILIGIATPGEAAAVGGVGALMLAAGRERGRFSALIPAAIVALLALLLLANVTDLTGVASGEIGAAALLSFLLLAIILAGVGLGLLRLGRSGILKAVAVATMEMTAMIFVILIGATIFSLAFRGLGGDDLVHEFLSDLPGGHISALLVVMTVIFLLGFFLDFVEITFVVVPVVAPVLLLMQIDPIWLGIMIAMNLQTSFLTPPFGFALFYLKGVAPAGITTAIIYRGVIPFVALQLLMLLILSLFPSLATWLPWVISG
ncbi:TRAP transporter large permease [Sneathiella sp.]|uniref:TRAP transporter large permease n=1 Tax=Sneathiella sp. TaxID=1964365 RepID=UPI002FE12645